MAASNPHLRAVRQAYDQVIAQATTAPDAQLTTRQAVALLRSSGKVRGLPRTEPRGVNGALQTHALMDLARERARRLPDPQTKGHWLTSVPVGGAALRQDGRLDRSRRCYKRTAYLEADELEEGAQRDWQQERAYHAKQVTEREAARQLRELDAQTKRGPHYWKDVRADVEAKLHASGETPYNL